MRDKKLIWLLALLTVFVTAHNVDHVIRDGVSLPLIVVVGVIYALVAAVFYLLLANKVGVRFFTIGSVAGFAFGWFAHLSPYTVQPPAVILAAYRSPLAGWLALSALLGIMLTLAAIAVYSSYRWSRKPAV